MERRKKYGIQTALQNYKSYSHYNKNRNYFSENNNNKKNRNNNSGQQGIKKNKIVFENNF